MWCCCGRSCHLVYTVYVIISVRKIWTCFPFLKHGGDICLNIYIFFCRLHICKCFSVYVTVWVFPPNSLLLREAVVHNPAWRCLFQLPEQVRDINAVWTLHRRQQTAFTKFWCDLNPLFVCLVLLLTEPDGSPRMCWGRGDCLLVCFSPRNDCFLQLSISAITDEWIWPQMVPLTPSPSSQNVGVSFIKWAPVFFSSLTRCLLRVLFLFCLHKLKAEERLPLYEWAERMMDLRCFMFLFLLFFPHSPLFIFGVCTVAALLPHSSWWSLMLL